MKWRSIASVAFGMLVCTGLALGDAVSRPHFSTAEKKVDTVSPNTAQLSDVTLNGRDRSDFIEDASTSPTISRDEEAAGADGVTFLSTSTRSPDRTSFTELSPGLDQFTYPMQPGNGYEPDDQGESYCGDPEAGSCCEANGTPFCDDANCCNMVCMFGNPSCCDTSGAGGWDEGCVAAAEWICGTCPTFRACCLEDGCADMESTECMLAGGTWFPDTHCADLNPGCPACIPEETLFTQTVGSSHPKLWGAISAVDAGQMFAERFWDVQGDICGMKWYGAGKDDGNHDCFEDPATFEIRFYRDNGYNQPGTEACSYTVTVDRIDRSDIGSGWAEYHAEFDTCCALESGHVSIAAASGSACMFGWYDTAAGEGDGGHCSYNIEQEAWTCVAPGDWDSYDLNICLLGTTYPGACCDEVAGTCNDDVEIDNCDGRFAPGKTCSQMNPTCGELAGACCIDEDPYCYIAAEVDCEGSYAGHGTTCDPTDCNANGRPDICDIASGASEDCNENGTPDECDIAAGVKDYDQNGVPDVCEADCNNNGVVDACDIDCYTGLCSTHPTGCGQSLDCQPNGVPDECEQGSTGNPLLWDNGLPSGEAVLLSCFNGPLQDAMTVDDINLPNGGRINGVHWYTEDEDGFDFQGRVRLAVFADNGHSAPSDSNELFSMWVPDDGGAVVRSVVGHGTVYPVRYRYDIHGIDIPLEPGIWWIGLSPEGSDDGGEYAGGSYWCASRSGTAVVMGGTYFRALGGFDSYLDPYLFFQPWPSVHGEINTDAAFSVTTSVFGADCNANGIPDDCDIADCDGSAWCQDCQLNGIPDGCEPDCNNNSIADQCDVLFCDGSSWCGDCNFNEIPDECDVPPLGPLPDCNNNATPDSCDLESGLSPDCNENDVPDECDLTSGYSDDYDANGNPDECDVDCNGNGKVDVCDLSCSVGSCASHPLGCETSIDCQPDDIPDECQTHSGLEYRTDDGIMDNSTGLSDGGRFAWLNQFTVEENYNTISTISIAWGNTPEGAPSTIYIWNDPNNDGKPTDATVLTSVSTVTSACNTGTFIVIDVPDTYIGPAGTSFFVGAMMDLQPHNHPAARDYDGWGTGWYAADTNYMLDPNNLAGGDVSLRSYASSWMIRAIGMDNNDCNQNTVPDECDIATGFSQDCDANGIPDECEWLDCDGNQVHDPCDMLNCDGSSWCSDCNGNGIPDTCDIAAQVSPDCQQNGIPDECDEDCDGNEIPDDCDIRDCDGSLWCEDCNVNGVPDGCESGPADNQPYQWDDGSTESTIGLGDDVEMAWIQRFATRSATDTIVAVQTAFGSPTSFPGSTDVQAGDTVRVFVWADAFGTASPNGAVLLASAAGIVDAASIDSDVLQEIPIGPVAVSGSFFVGASVYSTGYPVPMDVDGTLANESWVTFEFSFFGGFNPESFYADNLTGIGYPSNLLLRAVTPAGPMTTDCNENSIPDDCELCGDLDSDDDVDYYDYEIFLDAFGGETDYTPAVDWCCDYDKSGAVGMADFAAWLECYRDYVGDPEANPPSKPELDRPRRFTPVDNRQLVSPTQSANQSLQSTSRTLRR